MKLDTTTDEITSEGTTPHYPSPLARHTNTPYILCILCYTTFLGRRDVAMCKEAVTNNQTTNHEIPVDTANMSLSSSPGLNFSLPFASCRLQGHRSLRKSLLYIRSCRFPLTQLLSSLCGKGPSQFAVPKARRLTTNTQHTPRNMWHHKLLFFTKNVQVLSPLIHRMVGISGPSPRSFFLLRTPIPPLRNSQTELSA